METNYEHVMAAYSVTSRTMRRISRLFASSALWKYPVGCSRAGRHLCDSSKDRGARFQDEEVQKLLRKMTGLQLERVFKPAKQTLEPPSYKLVSSHKLEEMRKDALREAEERLQMPPVVDERAPIDEVLAEDEALAGLDTANFVFTDITYGLNDRKRFVVVREPSGKLRKATWDERDRVMQIYFPRKRREVAIPPMFHDEQLPAIFANERHEFLLDAACVQFEPDAQGFKEIHQKAYNDLESSGKFDLLRSTRHFGGMVYYLTTHKRIDALMTDMIQRDLLKDAVDLVRLYCLVQPASLLAQEVASTQLDGEELIKAYIRLDSRHSGKLELALQAWENERQRPVESAIE